jgi:hypothetical protein
VQVYTDAGDSMHYRTSDETKDARSSLFCNACYEAWKRMDESMNRSDEKHDLANDTVGPLQRKRTILCSLRVVPVTSEHFLGRRYVMELATTGLARELRVYRSLEELMRGVDDLGLPAELRDGLCRQLLEEGCCQLLDIVL